MIGVVGVTGVVSEIKNPRQGSETIIQAVASAGPFIASEIKNPRQGSETTNDTALHSLKPECQK